MASQDALSHSECLLMDDELHAERAYMKKKHNLIDDVTISYRVDLVV